MGHIDADQDRKKEFVFKIEIGGITIFATLGKAIRY